MHPKGGSGGRDEAGASPSRPDDACTSPQAPWHGAGIQAGTWTPWHTALPSGGTQATAGQHAACLPIQEGPPSPARGWRGSTGCRELPSPALGPGKLEGMLGGALGPQPSQPKILALEGRLDTKGQSGQPMALPGPELPWVLVWLELGPASWSCVAGALSSTQEGRWA